MISDPSQAPFWRQTIFGQQHLSFLNYAQAALTQQALERGQAVHSFHKTTALSKAYEVKDVLDHFLAAGMALAEHCLPPSSVQAEQWCFAAADGAAWVCYLATKREITVHALSLDAAAVSKVQSMAKLWFVRPPTRGRVYTVLSGQSGPYLQEMGMAGENFIPGNYRPEVVVDYRHVVADLNSSDPCGRIAILDGVPGTGKTHMICALLNEVPKGTFVLIPSSMMRAMAGPDLARVLMRQQRPGYPLILVVEDADECLSSRKADNVGALSALLNLSDGIFGSIMDLRVIATTNVDIGDVDDAVMRPGRLCRRVEVTKLDGAHAQAVYERLKGASASKFDEKKFYTLAEVYRAAKGGGGRVQVKPQRAVGFAMPTEPEPEVMTGSEVGDSQTSYFVREGGALRKIGEDEAVAMGLSSPDPDFDDDEATPKVAEDADLIDEDPED